jgi:hypothetical protein
MADNILSDFGINILEEEGIAVYVTGRMRCFYHFYLSWTPKGIEFIKEIINNRTRH